MKKQPKSVARWIAEALSPKQQRVSKQKRNIASTMKKRASRTERAQRKADLNSLEKSDG